MQHAFNTGLHPGANAYGRQSKSDSNVECLPGERWYVMTGGVNGRGKILDMCYNVTGVSIVPCNKVSKKILLSSAGRVKREHGGVYLPRVPKQGVGRPEIAINKISKSVARVFCTLHHGKAPHSTSQVNHRDGDWRYEREGE